MRMYVLLAYRFNKRLACWIRVARTWYADRDSISSGLDAIEGNTITQVKIQFRVTL
jgi:hypothetical protein